MANTCPWCGRVLKIKRVLHLDKIREVCSGCDFKLKEYDKPKPAPKEPEKPSPVEVRDHEKPIVKQKPMWPWIVGAIIIVLILIVLVRIFLV